MSWDIYGNRLTQGHCEVHPHVAEEYPCSLCIDESNKRSIDREREQEYHRLRVVKCNFDNLLDELFNSFPLFDENGLDPDIHHCEWNILHERKRLHSIITKFRNQNGDAVTACQSAEVTYGYNPNHGRRVPEPRR